MRAGRVFPFLGSVVVLAGMAVPVQAGLVDLGSGWRATWDVSLDGLVGIDVLSSDGETIVLRKTAEFTQGPVNGVFPSIPIVFQQTAFPAATSIVIDDEIITNSTGVDWTDFHLDLLDAGDAAFDPVATAASGGPGPIGWDISPFTAAVFSGDLIRLDVSGGVVPNGGVWTPGSGVGGGQLWIDVTPHAVAPFTTFTLKETPTPEPASMALMVLGAAAMAFRRRVA